MFDLDPRVFKQEGDGAQEVAPLLPLFTSSMSYRSWTFFRGSVDMLGELLHKRGYRVSVNSLASRRQAVRPAEAPLIHETAQVVFADDPSGRTSTGGCTCRQTQLAATITKASRCVPVHLKSTLGGAIPVDIEFAASCNDEG